MNDAQAESRPAIKIKEDRIFRPPQTLPEKMPLAHDRRDIRSRSPRIEACQKHVGGFGGSRWTLSPLRNSFQSPVEPVNIPENGSVRAPRVGDGRIVSLFKLVVDHGACARVRARVRV